MSDQSLQRVVTLVAETLRISPSKVNGASSIDTLSEWDSEAHMEICLAFEERFGIVLDMDMIGEMTSVAALAKVLDRRS